MAVLSTQCQGRLLFALTATLLLLCWRKSSYLIAARSQPLPCEFYTSIGVFREQGQRLQGGESSRCPSWATLGSYVNPWQHYQTSVRVARVLPSITLVLHSHVPYKLWVFSGSLSKIENKCLFLVYFSLPFWVSFWPNLLTTYQTWGRKSRNVQLEVEVGLATPLT